jgi:hypothetical protein
LELAINVKTATNTLAPSGGLLKSVSPVAQGEISLQNLLVFTPGPAGFSGTRARVTSQREVPENARENDRD